MLRTLDTSSHIEVIEWERLMRAFTTHIRWNLLSLWSYSGTGDRSGAS